MAPAVAAIAPHGKGSRRESLIERVSARSEPGQTPGLDACFAGSKTRKVRWGRALNPVTAAARVSAMPQRRNEREGGLHGKPPSVRRKRPRLSASQVGQILPDRTQ